ncbi:MAG: ZIP family metal transporter, partial [Candidatus Woesearchaeota archaeon]
LLMIIGATFLISLLSLVGIFFSHKKLHNNLHYMISFAAGTLLAAAFIHMIPHALEKHVPVYHVLAGIMIFFFIERFIHWHHCGREECHQKPAGLLILTGDFIHNFLDGLLIAGSFLHDPVTGIVATVTIAMHEIPQEFGDYTVLLHSGFKQAKALLFNFYSALSAVIGGVLGYFFLGSLEGSVPYAVMVTAGGFIYIALSDIVPGMHKHKSKELIIESLVMVGAILLFSVIMLALNHSH